MVTVEDIRWKLANKHNDLDYVTDKSGCKMLEVINASFVADEDYIFREPNQDYIERELEWYKSKSLNVDDIPGARPGVLHASLNKPSLGYTNADIPGSQAKPYTFKTSRCVAVNVGLAVPATFAVSSIFVDAAAAENVRELSALIIDTNSA